MSKKKQKKSGNKKDQPASTINLITAIVNLVIAILLLIEKLTRKRAGGEIPLALISITQKTLNVNGAWIQRFIFLWRLALLCRSLLSSYP